MGVILTTYKSWDDPPSTLSFFHYHSCTRLGRKKNMTPSKGSFRSRLRNPTNHLILWHYNPSSVGVSKYIPGGAEVLLSAACREKHPKLTRGFAMRLPLLRGSGYLVIKWIVTRVIIPISWLYVPKS